MSFLTLNEVRETTSIGITLTLKQSRHSPREVSAAAIDYIMISVSLSIYEVRVVVITAANLVNSLARV